MDEKYKYDFESIKSELKQFMSLSLPVFMFGICRLGMSVTDSIFLGHIGILQMAAAALSDSWMWGLLYFGIGLLFALDTYVSQAFGAKNFKAIGIASQTAFLLCVLMTIPFSIIFFFTEDILLLLQQKPELAKLAGEFSRYSIPAVLPVLLWRATERYLQGQKILYPGVIVGIVGFLLNIGFNYFFIYICNLGFKGSAIATTTSRCLQIILYWIIIFWKGLHKGTNDTIHKESFTLKAIMSYLKLGLPNAVWFFLESMGWNIITVIIGATLKDEFAIDAHMISLNIMIISFIPTLAWCTASGTRVGNLIGEKRPFNAKYSANIYLIFSTAITIFTSILIIVGRDYIIKVWNSDERVFDTARTLFIFASVLILFDAFQSVVTSVLRAIGRQIICAVMTLGYWVIGIPLGLILFKFANLGIYSFYWSLGTALVVNSTVILIYYLRVDWEDEVIRAFDRMNEINKNSLANTAEGKEELKYLVTDKSESMSITIEDSESSLNDNS